MTYNEEIDIEKIVEEMRMLRLNILPAYCYDEDESEKSVEDYLTYYSGNIANGLVALDNYINALQEFKEKPELEDNVGKLMNARAEFIQNFPFCYDELADIEPDKHLQYFEFDPKFSHKQDYELKFVIDRLHDYKKLLESLRDEV